MNKVFRIFQYLLLAGGFCLSTFLSNSSGQAVNDKGFSDFFDGQPKEESVNPPTKKESSGILDFFLKPKSKSEDPDIQEVEIAPNPHNSLKTKEMVEVPASLPKVQIDASDFEDPFYRVRGFQENSGKALEPGTTLDGVQFQSYGDTNKFIEKFYKESKFSLEDVYGKVEYLERRGGCYTCHQGIERISSNHRFSCVRCHGGNRRANSLPKAHTGLVPNPSSAKNAPRFCGKCHENHVSKVERSLMSTAKRTINITRYAWGAQPLDELPYSLKPDNDEQAFPNVPEGHAVDGFLRTKCLRCHIGSESPHRPGDYRASGCSSCHMIYSNDGISLSHDRAIQKIQKKKKNKNRFTRKFAENSLNNPRGYPLLHQFTVAVPSVQCEHCHSNNSVGEEFEGLFAKPSRPMESPDTVNAEKSVLYGKEHEFLVPDIHREKGMHCIDCHIGDEMKPEIEPDQLQSGVQIRCVDCHGNQEKLPEEFLLIESDPNTKKLLKRANLNPNLKKKVRAGDTILINSSGSPLLHIKKIKKEWVLYSKVTGKKHKIPLLKNLKPSIAHQIPKHMQEMECATCHARWAATDWGMHVIREKDFTSEKWKNWNLSDPTLQNLLATPSTEKSGMLDWLTAKSLPDKIDGNAINEYWWTLFSDSGWSQMVMGKNSRGKYALLKPRYQYFITDQTGPTGLPLKRAEPPLTLDDSIGLVWTDYSPHTIRKTTRSCEDCHQNSLAVGLGDSLKKSLQDAGQFFSELKQNHQVHPDFQLKQGIDANGEALQNPFPQDGSRFLNQEEITILREPSDQYRAFRSLNLRELNFSRLLSRSEFPYDVRHRVRERDSAQPQPREDLFYDVEKNKFVKIEKPKEPQKPFPVLIPEPPAESGIEENKDLTLEPSLDKKEEGIIEFLYDIFQENEKTEEPLPQPNEATPL
ncbi:MAG: hypothetical protein H8E32_05925 [Nitrospinae bacterium]|nr:hypothetical protein [Nitrospinota bacterium]